VASKNCRPLVSEGNAMQSRLLVLASSAVAIAALLVGISPPASAAAAVDQKKSYDKKLVLYDVKGDAKIIKKYGHIYKVYDDLEFKKGKIYIDKIKCYYGYCDLKGNVSGYIYDHYYKLAELSYEGFKAKAIIYKKEYYQDYQGASYHPKPPEEKCDVEIDIGVIKIVDKEEYDRYGKQVKIIFVDPDRQELYVKDPYRNKYLCEQAKHYDYDTPGAEEAS
jgi:hypothetical protein